MIHDDLISSAATAIAGKKEAAIREALDALCGPWTMDQVKDRCMMIRTADSPVETLYIDGEPAIEFYPIEHETVKHEHHYSIRFTQNVRHLWKKATAESSQSRFKEQINQV